MDENLILIRRREVEQEIARLKSRLQEMQTEMAELDTAERVLARLSGAGRPKARAADEPKPAETPSRKPGNLPSMPDMIKDVLERARLEDGTDGLQPKELTRAIAERWWPEVSGESVSSIAWRMWKRGQLEKDGSIYMLPQKDKAGDEQSVGDTSPAFDLNPQQGREAGPGGGT